MKARKWEKCCEEVPTIDPETGRCQNGCGPKTPTPSVPDSVALAEKIYWILSNGTTTYGFASQQIKEIGDLIATFGRTQYERGVEEGKKRVKVAWIADGFKEGIERAAEVAEKLNGTVPGWKVRKEIRALLPPSGGAK